MAVGWKGMKEVGKGRGFRGFQERNKGTCSGGEIKCILQALARPHLYKVNLYKVNG